MQTLFVFCMLIAMSLDVPLTYIEILCLAGIVLARFCDLVLTSTPQGASYSQQTKRFARPKEFLYKKDFNLKFISKKTGKNLFIELATGLLKIFEKHPKIEFRFYFRRRT